MPNIEYFFKKDPVLNGLSPPWFTKSLVLAFVLSLEDH